MAVPSLEILASRASIPECSPNLMPFHISYTGPSPISTYFRVKKAQDPNYGDKTTTTELSASVPQADSQVTLVDEPSTSSSSSLPTPNSLETLAHDVEMSSQATPDDDGRHLVAAFRGRTVRGLKVELPEGYTGVVLNAPNATTSASSTFKPKSARKAAPASKRRTRNSTPHDVDADDEPDMNDLAEALEDVGPIRRLETSATFSSFVLWNADIPVDEGRDEYMRSLTEWTKLAAEIHRHDDDE